MHVSPPCACVFRCHEHGVWQLDALHQARSNVKVISISTPNRVENVMETAEGSKQTNTVVAFHLQSDAADGQRRIDAFVDTAYAHYQARRRVSVAQGTNRHSESAL